MSKQSTSSGIHTTIHNSSTVPTDVYKFRSKDGLHYSTYTDYVAANVIHNNKILKEKGLDQESLRILRKNSTTTKTKTARGTNRKYDYSKDSNDDNDDDVDTGNSVETRTTRSTTQQNSTSSLESRRSIRLMKQRDNEVLGPNKNTDLVRNGSINDRNEHGTEYDSNFVVMDGEIQKRRPRKRSRVKSMESDNDDNSNTTNGILELTIDEREQLHQIPSDIWIEQMDLYLSNVEKLSDPNRKNVMKQITKLVNGYGITYHHWKPINTHYYEQNKKWTLGIDTNEMYNRAIFYEDTYGRDLGNGWLLRHPITKLSNFQAYYVSKILNRK